MSNNKSNMQILRELSEKHHKGDFTDEEREKMKQWKKYLMKLWTKLSPMLIKNKYLELISTCRPEPR